MAIDYQNLPAQAVLGSEQTAELYHPITGEVLVANEQARQAASDLLGLLDPSLPRPQQAADEAEVEEMARTLYDSATWALVTESLLQQARERHPAFTEVERARERRALEESARHMENRNYGEIAPNFAEQLKDNSRTTSFKYNNLPPHIDPEGWETKSATEVEGLRDLDTFLNFFLALSEHSDGSYEFPEDAEQARSMLDNLTFIGEPEYARGAAGLAMLWRSYLDGDEKRKLCIITGSSHSQKYPGQRKSDLYLKERAMQNFTDEEIEKYGSRIFDSFEAVEEESPDNVRIVLLDDWTISGRQMNRIYDELAEDPDFARFSRSTEINVLVASEGRLRHGLEDPNETRGPIRVRAFYKAHTAPKVQSPNEAHIAGLHSTVNYDFGDTIEHIAKRFDALGVPQDLPPLASIVRPYRSEMAEEEVAV